MLVPGGTFGDVPSDSDASTEEADDSVVLPVVPGSGGDALMVEGTIDLHGKDVLPAPRLDIWDDDFDDDFDD